MILDEKVTGKHIAVVLDDNILIAFRAKGADRMAALQAVGKNRIKHTDADFPRSVVVPAIEDAAEEAAVLLGGNGEIQDSTGFLVLFDTGDKLHIFYVEFQQEIEDFIRRGDVMIVEQDQDVELHLVLAAGFDSGGDAVEGAAAGVIETIVIVIFFRPIEADPDQDFIFVQESAPLIVIEHDSVGLESVADGLAVLAILFLEFDDLAVKIQAHQGGFAALPGEAAVGKSQLHIIPDEFFHHLVAHAVFLTAEKPALLRIETIRAGQVAIWSRRFN